MPQHSQTEDFRIEAPDDWIERSMIVWSAPPMPGNALAPNVLIAYDKPRVGETLVSYVDRQMKDLGAKAQRFQLELRRDVTLSDRPAVEVMFRWDSGGGFLKQRQLYSLASGGRVISIVNTARQQDFDAAEPKFLSVLNSFVWAEPVASDD